MIDLSHRSNSVLSTGNILTDKRIIECGLFVFVIFLQIGRATVFKFIGLYVPALKK